MPDLYDSNNKHNIAGFTPKLVGAHEEESSPLLCGFTAMLFGSMPLAYKDSMKVKMVLVEKIQYLFF